MYEDETLEAMVLKDIKSWAGARYHKQCHPSLFNEYWVMRLGLK